MYVLQYVVEENKPKLLKQKLKQKPLADLHNIKEYI